MRKELAQHPDFKHKKNMIEQLLMRNGHVSIFLPKFHPELNPIESTYEKIYKGSL